MLWDMDIGSHVVSATGPGNPPAVQVVTGVSVRIGSKPAKNPTRFVLAGMFPGPHIILQFFGGVSHAAQPHFR